MQLIANSTGKVAGWGLSFERLTIVLYGMNQLLPRHRTSRPFVCAHLRMFDLSEYGTPRASRSKGVSPRLVRWKMYSWQSFTYLCDCRGLKCPAETCSPSFV